MRLTMLRLNSRQRTLIAEKLFDIANVAAGAMIFGQFLAERGFSTALATAGVVVWGLLVAFGLALEGGRDS
jgi:hypothetical protein